MPAKPHLYEQAAEDIAQWIDQTAVKLADGLRGGGKAPFAANATQSEKLAYYESKLFNPDGSENVEGSMKEMHRLGLYGPKGYLATKAEVLKARQERMSGASVGQEAQG